jgi:hypothetical protein
MRTLRSFCLTLGLTASFLLALAQKSSNTSIDKITAAYLGVKNALAADDGATAENKGKELFAALSADPDKGLKPDQQKLFDSYLDKLKYDSRHISETTTVDHQREHFASLSKNLYEVLKGLKLNTTTIYMEYCPMKKAYWLSESSAIVNPYYSGEMMSGCGRVSATLPGVK